MCTHHAANVWTDRLCLMKEHLATRRTPVYTLSYKKGSVHVCPPLHELTIRVQSMLLLCVVYKIQSTTDRIVHRYCTVRRGMREG